MTRTSEKTARPLKPSSIRIPLSFFPLAQLEPFPRIRTPAMPDLLNTIDISSYLTGTASPIEAKELALKLVQESERVGFFYVKGWESIVSKDLVERVFDYVSSFPSVSHDSELTWEGFSQNERFFDLPLEVKNSLAYTSSKANRGYLSFGREQASLATQVTLNGGEGEETKPQEIERDQKLVVTFATLYARI